MQVVSSKSYLLIELFEERILIGLEKNNLKHKTQNETFSFFFETEYKAI